jgi:hypothetical protein
VFSQDDGYVLYAKTGAYQDFRIEYLWRAPSGYPANDFDFTKPAQQVKIGNFRTVWDF